MILIFQDAEMTVSAGASPPGASVQGSPPTKEWSEVSFLKVYASAFYHPEHAHTSLTEIVSFWSIDNVHETCPYCMLLPLFDMCVMSRICDHTHTSSVCRHGFPSSTNISWCPCTPSAAASSSSSSSSAAAHSCTDSTEESRDPPVQQWPRTVGPRS